MISYNAIAILGKNSDLYQSYHKPIFQHLQNKLDFKLHEFSRNFASELNSLSLDDNTLAFIYLKPQSIEKLKEITIEVSQNFDHTVLISSSSVHCIDQDYHYVNLKMKAEFLFRATGASVLRIGSSDVPQKNISPVINHSTSETVKNSLEKLICQSGEGKTPVFDAYLREEQQIKGFLKLLSVMYGIACEITGSNRRLLRPLDLILRLSKITGYGYSYLPR